PRTNPSHGPHNPPPPHRRKQEKEQQRTAPACHGSERRGAQPTPAPPSPPSDHRCPGSSWTAKKRHPPQPQRQGSPRTTASPAPPPDAHAPQGSATRRKNRDGRISGLSLSSLRVRDRNTAGRRHPTLSRPDAHTPPV